MRLASVVFRVSYALRRRASSGVTLVGDPKGREGEDNVTLKIPFAIQAPWGSGQGSAYGKAKVTFNWLDNKVPLDDFGIVDDIPRIEIMTIDGNPLSSKDKEALEKAGLNDLTLAVLYADNEDSQEDEDALPTKSISDWLF